ncbi:hypothetical protein KBT16_03755, partial [Nostoc sp. CCCryo 231-06]|nr:hypothetical protein [Nostoc sp. CCCryo 231-06]
MPRLTVPPNFIGTPSTDTLVGEELNASVAIGIDILTGGYIRTLSGKDAIAGIGTGAIGIDGDDNDNIGGDGGDGGTGTGIVNIGKLNT